MMSAHRIIIIELVSTGQYDAAKELILNNKCDVNEKSEDGGYCAVFAAIERNDLHMLKLLVNDGKANLNIEDDFGFTPLQSAKDIENIEMVKFIEETLAGYQKTISVEKKQDVSQPKKNEEETDRKRSSSVPTIFFSSKTTSPNDSAPQSSKRKGTTPSPSSSED